MKTEQQIKKFNKQANKYDKRRKRQSQDIWRKRIFKTVRGKTLEVAVGAGMNFAFYSNTIDYVGVDFSPVMLEKAEFAAKSYSFKSEFLLSPVEELSFPENTFDTIVSSGTLCSYEDPIEVLNLFNVWCKNDGQILLLEHGLFDKPALSWLQKKLDPIAYKMIGCHLNRNMIDIVNKSDIEISRFEKGYLGALNLIWAKPLK